MEYLLLTEDGQTRQPLPVAHTTPSLHTVQGKQVASQLPERFELSHKDCKCTEILQHSLCHCIYSNHFNVTTHSNHIGEPFAPATMRALAARTLPTVHLSSLILTETLTRPNICVLFYSFLFLCAILSYRQSWGHWQQQKRTGQSTRKCTTTVHCWHTSQLSGIQQKLWRQWHSR